METQRDSVWFDLAVQKVPMEKPILDKTRPAVSSLYAKLIDPSAGCDSIFHKKYNHQVARWQISLLIRYFPECRTTESSTEQLSNER